MMRLNSLIDHTRNRIVEQRSLMTCLPTEDARDLLSIAIEKRDRELAEKLAEETHK